MAAGNRVYVGQGTRGVLPGNAKLARESIITDGPTSVPKIFGRSSAGLRRWLADLPGQMGYVIVGAVVLGVVGAVAAVLGLRDLAAAVGLADKPRQSPAHLIASMQTKTDKYPDWEDAIWVAPGETVHFYVAFGNDGETPSLRNRLVVSLPPSLIYITDSCLKPAKNDDGDVINVKCRAPQRLTAGGLRYERLTGKTAIRFSAQVAREVRPGSTITTLATVRALLAQAATASVTLSVCAPGQGPCA